MPIAFVSIGRVTHAEDRTREARYWAGRSIAERVIAGWTLADNNLIPRRGSLIQKADHEPEKRTGVTLRRVARVGR